MAVGSAGPQRSRISAKRKLEIVDEESHGGFVQEVVRCLARALVSRPDQVHVEEFDEGDALVVELEVAPGDLGRVIGRHGRTADALRTIVSALGRRRGENWELEILD